MSQPAARLGDPTAHGGAITSGNPTVLIGGQPAATLGDLHVCPMCSPGPHVGGPILAGAPTVLIGGKPAARLGDMCTCAAPAPDVILAGCPTVLIGGASGAASPGAAAAAASAHGATANPGTPGLGATARPLSPWVGVGYVDAAGRPVTGWHYHAEGDRQRDGQLGTGGQVWLDALAEAGAVEVGLVGVYGCRWARDEARVGEAVAMSARCVGVADGAAAAFEVWRESTSPGGAASRAKVWEVTGNVRGGRVEAEAPFVFEHGGDSAPGSTAGSDAETPVASPPRPGNPNGGGGDGNEGAGASSVFVAEVSVGGLYRAHSAPLRLVDRVEIQVVDTDGKSVEAAEYRVQLEDGSVRTGTTDRDGRLVEEAVPLGTQRLGVSRPS